jgi:hypothetical protein
LENAFPSTAASSNLLKYRALYEFVARNSDELSFQPGDVIMVSFILNPCFVKKEIHIRGLFLYLSTMKEFDMLGTVVHDIVIKWK